MSARQHCLRTIGQTKSSDYGIFRTAEHIRTDRIKAAGNQWTIMSPLTCDVGRFRIQPFWYRCHGSLPFWKQFISEVIRSAESSGSCASATLLFMPVDSHNLTVEKLRPYYARLRTIDACLKSNTSAKSHFCAKSFQGLLQECVTLWSLTILTVFSLAPHKYSCEQNLQGTAAGFSRTCDQ